MTGYMFDPDGTQYLYWPMTRKEINALPMVDAMTILLKIEEDGAFKGEIFGNKMMIEMIEEQ